MAVIVEGTRKIQDRRSHRRPSALIDSFDWCTLGRMEGYEEQKLPIHFLLTFNA